MNTMTIRNVSPEVAAALDEEKRRRGLSLNRTVLANFRRGEPRVVAVVLTFDTQFEANTRVGAHILRADNS